MSTLLLDVFSGFLFCDLGRFIVVRRNQKDGFSMTSKLPVAVLGSKLLNKMFHAKGLNESNF